MKTHSIPAGREPLLPMPFTREQIREDICNIFLFEARKAVHLHGMSFISKPTFLDGFDHSNYSFGWDCQEYNPSELGITYEKVSHFLLARAVEDCFDYAFYATVSERTDSLEYESIHTWIGYYLQDSTQSSYFYEWESYGSIILESFKRCLFVYELANARLLLEGEEEPICYFKTNSKDEDGGFGELSIHQLSMLAGIEELSLRSTISRKTAPILEIKKDDRRTYIETYTAKQWLIAKGRYQPVLIRRRSVDLDLKATKFKSIWDFLAMLRDRVAFIGAKTGDQEALTSAINEKLLPHNVDGLSSLEFNDLHNSVLIDSIAVLLELPTDLLNIRAKEAALKSLISDCELQLKQLQHT